MSKNYLFNQLANLVSIAVLLVMTSACNDEKESSAAEKTNSPASTAAVVKLSETPIDLRNYYSSASSEVIPPCPLLSDESANKAIINPNPGKPLIRSIGKRNHCEWSLEGAFFITVRATPLAEAKPVSSHAYNIDVKPVQKAITGLGDSATLLLDPTWDADNPRVFALIMDASGRRFEIKTLSVRTSEAQLQSVAEEIIARLPEADAQPEAKPAELADPCVFDAMAVANLFGGTEAPKVTPSTKISMCQYKGFISYDQKAEYERISLSLALKAGKHVPIGPDYERVTDKDTFTAPVEVLVRFDDRDNREGSVKTNRSYLIVRPDGYIVLDVNIDGPYPDTEIKALVNNLIKRTS